MDFFRNIASGIPAQVVCCVYVINLTFSLLAGISHELHHIINHSLDLHHHHGQPHDHSKSDNSAHSHGHIMDGLLEEAGTDESSHDTVQALTVLKTFEHNGLVVANTFGKPSDSQELFYSEMNPLRPEYYHSPDPPPPKLFL